MTCSDADRIWDEVLDARSAGDPGRERQIAAHAEACPRCRAAAERYRTLRAAMAAMGPPPAPSDGFAGRFLESSRAARVLPAVARRSPAPWFALATAASVLAVAWLGTRPPAPTPGVARAEVRLHLASALADATSATIEMARGVSAPAARIGLDVLDLEGVEFAVAEIEPGAGPPIGPASDLLRSVGERIDSGARPLSGSARHAFGFLIPPSSDADRPPAVDDDGG